MIYTIYIDELMMAKIHCLNCAGSGQVLGNGMIIDECKSCFGVGKIDDVDTNSSGSVHSDDNGSAKHIIDKRSKAYRQSIKELLKTDPSLTITQAQELFENAYKKQA